MVRPSPRAEYTIKEAELRGKVKVSGKNNPETKNDLKIGAKAAERVVVHSSKKLKHTVENRSHVSYKK